jgi:general secretion pathway protein K
MTPELLARLKPHRTLYSEADPDGSTTDPVVAAALAAKARAAPHRAPDEGSQVATVSIVVRGPRRRGYSERVVVRTNVLDGIRRHEILLREPVTIPC